MKILKTFFFCFVASFIIPAFSKRNYSLSRAIDKDDRNVKNQISESSIGDLMATKKNSILSDTFFAQRKFITTVVNMIKNIIHVPFKVLSDFFISGLKPIQITNDPTAQASFDKLIASPKDEKKPLFEWSSLAPPIPILQPSPAIIQCATASIDPPIKSENKIQEETNYARSILERIYILLDTFFELYFLSFFLITLSLCATVTFLTLPMMKYMSSKVDCSGGENCFSSDLYTTSSDYYIMSYDTLEKQYSKNNSTITVVSEKTGVYKDREDHEHGEEEKEDPSSISSSGSAFAYHENFTSLSSEIGSKTSEANIVFGQWSQVREIERLKEMGMTQSDTTEEFTAIPSPDDEPIGTVTHVQFEEKSEMITHISTEMKEKDLMSVNLYHDLSMDSLNSTTAYPSVSPTRIVTNKTFKCVYPFDGNGVISYLTSTEIPKVRVKMSSVFQGSEVNIISRSSENDATYTENEVNSWVALDLGNGRRLVPTCYCIRHGASSPGNALRNWELRARVRENDNWDILKVHENDEALSDVPFSVAKWEIPLLPLAEVASVIKLEKGEDETNVVEGYRYFLILQTDINSSNNNCLFIGGLEFYGLLSE